MTDEMYLLDNNVLSHLSLAQRTSSFFLERCRLPLEVLHEAESYPDAATLKLVGYPTTARVLELLRRVMATVPESDTSLVDLYANKGAADPLLIACALHAAEEAAPLLWKPAWVVVSNDKAVRAKASELSVTAYTREEFLVATQHDWDA
jgi:hypothetical protein